MGTCRQAGRTHTPIYLAFASNKKPLIAERFFLSTRSGNLPAGRQVEPTQLCGDHLFQIKKPLIAERFFLSTRSGNRTHTPKYTSLSRARLPIPPSGLRIQSFTTMRDIDVYQFVGANVNKFSS